MSQSDRKRAKGFQLFLRTVEDAQLFVQIA
jgi:hypothetical protein